MRSFLLLPALAFLLVSCSSSEKAVTSSEAKVPDEGMGKSVIYPHSIDSLFRSAIQDALNPEPKDIYRNLTRIEGNPNVIDTVIDGNVCILVSSWKSNPAYYPDKGAYNTGNYDIWVTVAPQVQERCKAYTQYYATQEEVEMRLRQLLGLQPNNQQKFFLELWVRSQDLFRPCPDNGTSDTECGLTLPDNVDSAYRAWFNNIRAVQYTDCSDTLFGHAGYPWTQLGYTYDWSADNPSHVGMSEFIIKRNATVWVRDKVPTKEYCSK